MAREIYPNHLPLPSPPQVSPSSAKPGNLMLKESEATGLGKTWKQGMKKGVASATNLTNPLLRACLPFFFFFSSKWDLQKEIRYSKRPLNFMQPSETEAVSSFAPAYRAMQPYQSLLFWSLMQLCREEELAAVVRTGRSTLAGLPTKEAHRTAQQEECSGL